MILAIYNELIGINAAPVQSCTEYSKEYEYSYLEQTLLMWHCDNEHAHNLIPTI